MARPARACGHYYPAMDRFLNLRPTPEALKNGRRTMVIVAIIVIGIGLFNVLIPDAADANMWAILGTTCLTLVGDGIAYLGQPTLLRYRAGLVITAVGIASSFYLLIVEPFKSVAT